MASKLFSFTVKYLHYQLTFDDGLFFIPDSSGQCDNCIIVCNYQLHHFLGSDCIVTYFRMAVYFCNAISAGLLGPGLHCVRALLSQFGSVKNILRSRK